MTTTIIRDLDAFVTLRAEWNALLHRSHADGVFLTWEWISTWWQTFGAGQQLFVVAARDADGCLSGVAPLSIARQRYRGIPYRQLAFIGHGGQVCPEHLDFIVDARCQDGAARLLHAILAADADWDVLDLSDLRDDALALSAIRQGAGARPHEWSPRAVCPFLTLPASWDDYLGSLSANSRSQIRRRWRRLQREHGARVVCVEDEAQLPEAMTTLFRLHGARWGSRPDAASFARDPRTRDFHETVARRFLERGWLRLYFLKAGGAPAAALLGYQYGRTFSYYQAGFEPAWAPYAVGAALMGEVIRDAIGRGLAEFDFLRGQEPFKSRWTPQVRQTWIAQVWGRSAAARVHCAVKRTVTGARRLAAIGTGSVDS